MFSHIPGSPYPKTNLPQQTISQSSATSASSRSLTRTMTPQLSGSTLRASSMRSKLPQSIPCSSCMRARIIQPGWTQRRTSGASLRMCLCRRGILLSLIVRTIGMHGRYVSLPPFLPPFRYSNLKIVPQVRYFESRGVPMLVCQVRVIATLPWTNRDLSSAL